jgi:hypothetical protein
MATKKYKKNSCYFLLPRVLAREPRNPVGDCQHWTVAALGERKANGGRTPLLAFAAPGDAFPSRLGSLEFLLLLGSSIELYPLILVSQSILS